MLLKSTDAPRAFLFNYKFFERGIILIFKTAHIMSAHQLIDLVAISKALHDLLLLVSG